MDGICYQWKFLLEVPGTSCLSISRPFNVDPNYKTNQYATFGNRHLNYLSKASPLGPLSISLFQEGSHFKVIVRSREGMFLLIYISFLNPCSTLYRYRTTLCGNLWVEIAFSRRYPSGNEIKCII